LSQVSRPTHRSADLGGSHLSASSASRFPTAIEVQSPPLLKLVWSEGSSSSHRPI
jgi:hypothetical protein